MAHKIAAVSTGWVRAGIGIVRMSGDGCIETAAKLFAANNQKPLTQQPDRAMILGTLHDAQARVIDRCIAVVSHAPHSYTGEDTCEFQCHGSPALLTAVLNALYANGFRPAQPGEFTKRAFLNGRMDLTQAEAVIDLIDAETTEAACNAAGQLGGAIEQKIEPLYTALSDICAHFHAVLDYPDEDIEPFRLENFRQTLTNVQKELSALLATGAHGKRLKNGIRAVILGAPNAGKSSLLNALCGYERVIVTDLPGTTRDAVEESVTLGRHLVRLLDTAGIRQTDDRVEQMGVARAELAAKDADLAILVLDGSRPLSAEDRRAVLAAQQCAKVLALANKADLPCALDAAALPFSPLPVSAKTGEGLPALEDALTALFPQDVPCDGSILTNARQLDALSRASEAVEAALASMQLGITPDAVLLDVESAMNALGELSGRTIREDITNRIFERFCVGK